MRPLYKHSKDNKEILRTALCHTMDCVAHLAPLSVRFPRQEYWSRLSFPSPGDLPKPGIKPKASSLQADSLWSEPPGKPQEQLNASKLDNLVETYETPAYRFLRRQVRRSGIPISFKIFQFCCDLHSQRLKHSQWSRSRCFSSISLLGNLISGSSAFCKPSLYIWKF